MTGPDGFSVRTVRKNPAKLGAVTGSATYDSFWNSLLSKSFSFQESINIYIFKANFNCKTLNSKVKKKPLQDEASC